jgi:hypothetical protein
MNTKFKVKFETKLWINKYDQEYLSLLNVIPQLLSLNCPHCQVYSVMKIDSTVERFERDNEDDISYLDKNLLFDFICSCPNCDHTVFVQAQAHGNAVCPDSRAADEQLEASSSGKILSVYPYPKNVTVPRGVPKKYADDFHEAVLVIPVSSTASAVLSRRILQNILRDEFKIQARDLYQEIGAFIAQPNIPPQLTDAVDAIRKIGNLAAHPLKNKNTGEVVPVEPDEAEWLIEVLKQLFEFKFTEPLIRQERQDKLDAKLRDAKLRDLNKPPMK